MKRRRNRGQRSLSRLGAAAMSELLEKRMMLASIVVNSAGDDVTGGDGLTTLREAINAANNDAAPDTITFSLGGGAQTINLTNSLPDLTSDMTIQGPGSGLLTVKRSTVSSYRDFNITAGHTIALSGMTIMNGSAGTGSGGNILNTGSNLSISGCVISSGNARFGGGIANVAGGTLTLSSSQLSANVASSDGGGIDNFSSTATLTDCTFSTNRVSRFGGGMDNNGGTLSVTHCTFVDNSADRGGGVIETFSNASTTVTTSSFTSSKAPGVNNPTTAEGGAILNSAGCNLNVSNSSFSGSVALFRGGAISNLGIATFSGCTLSTSSATNGAGGAFYNSGSLTLSSSTLNANTANGSGGGGIANADGTLNVTACTVSNSTANYGAGIASYSSGGSGATANITSSTINNNTVNNTVGGGIYNDVSSTLKLTNSTVANNFGYTGGGVYNNGTFTCESSTIAHNSIYYYAAGVLNDASGNATFHNSIVAQNNYYDIYNYGTVDTSDDNWIGDNNGDARLGDLANNGGPTQTIGLLADSPCIDAGPVTSTLSTDQRGSGFARITGAAQDLGAYEIQHIVVDNTGDVADGDYSALHLTLREAIGLANSSPGTEIIDFDSNVFATPQTINLASALPTIVSDVLLKGPGTDKVNIHRDPAASSFRIFTINPGKTVSMSNLAITDGKSALGGAIRNGGTLVLDHVALRDNSAPGNGGAIYNEGNLDIHYSTLSNNNAFAGSGGGIFNQNGSVSIDRSTFDHDNASISGGAIYNNTGSVYVRTSTYNANTTEHNGGAIFNFQGYIDVAGSTLAGNTATLAGGGIYTNNGSTYIQSNIIAQNTAPSGADTFGDYLYDFGYNFIGGDPMLGALADNGGPTRTMELLKGSPCINAGNSGIYATSEFDQRGPGHPRFGGFAVDIGAFEYQGFHESLIVTTTNDEDDGTSDPSFGAGTSLREAIEYANVHDGPDTVTFDLGAGAHTINLTGQLSLNSEMTINGPGANLLDIHRDTGGDYSLMSINASANLSGITLSNGDGYYGGIYISGGTVNIDHCTLRDNNASGYGGAIYSYAGNVIITDSTLINNTAAVGGGAIYLDYYAALQATNTTFTNNTADDRGGAIYNYTATVNLDHCTFTGNGTANSGGAIHNDYGTLNLRACTLDNNSSAGQGGGIYSYNGSLNVTDSTLSANQAAREGGAISSYYTTIQIANSTIADNGAFNRIGGQGGGIESFYGALTIDRSTIAGNTAYKGGGIYSAVDFTVNNSIVAANISAGSNPNAFGNALGAYNFIGGDPKLAPLADNGGSTQTMALLPDSPCIDAGDPSFTSPPDFDQRGTGFKRVRNGHLDIGAFEYSVPTVSNIAAAVDEDQTLAFSTASFDAAFIDPDAMPLTQVKILTLPAHGSLMLGNASVVAGQVIDRADLATLAYLPGSNYNGPDSLTWTATNGTTYAPGSASINITVNPVNDGPGGTAPTVSVTEDGSVNVTLNGSDVETPIAQLKFAILSLPTRGTLKYNGNAVTVGQTIVGSPASLVYECGAIAEGPGTDSFTFNVTDGGDGTAAPKVSSTATANINITKAVEDRQVVLGAGGIVRIGGTGSGDRLTITTGNGKLRVSLGSVLLSSSIPLGSITELRVWSRGGNDTVDISGLSSSIKTYIHGGAGNDNLSDGSGAGILIGGDGNDTAHGGHGNDLLIGGDGSDQLYGDEDNDVLIAGLPSLKLTLGALRNISNAWNSTKTSQATLLGTVSDTEADSLTGGSSADWFVKSSADKLYDLNKGQKDLSS